MKKNRYLLLLAWFLFFAGLAFLASIFLSSPERVLSSEERAQISSGGDAVPPSPSHEPMPVQTGVSCPQSPDRNGTPVVKTQHIFCGEIIRGRAKGFHSRPHGINPATVTGTNPSRWSSGPEGVYQLRDFTIIQQGERGRKTLSTMFPDHCDRDAVIAAIRNAAKRARPGARFHGSSGESCQAGSPPASFAITGFTDSQGAVITAWPDY